MVNICTKLGSNSPVGRSLYAIQIQHLMSSLQKYIDLNIYGNVNNMYGSWDGSVVEDGTNINNKNHTNKSV